MLEIQSSLTHHNVMYCIHVHYHVFTIYITCTVHYSQFVISLYVDVDVSSNIPYATEQDLLSKRGASDGP